MTDMVKIETVGELIEELKKYESSQKIMATWESQGKVIYIEGIDEGILWLDVN